MKSDADYLEKEIEAKVVAYAKQKSALCFKFTSPSCRSVPDRLIIPDGLPPFMIEFKRLGKVATPAQRIEIEKIRRQGMKVFVVDRVSEGKRIIDENATF